MDVLEYTRQDGHAVMAWMVPTHLIHGGRLPELAPHERIPESVFRFDAAPGQLGKVPVGVVKHLVNPHGNGRGGDVHFADVIEQGKLRFRRGDLVKLGYKGAVGSSIDPLLGQESVDDSETREQMLHLEAEVNRLHDRLAVVTQSELDKEIELARLQAQIAADERAKAEAEAKKAEAEARKAAAEARKAEAAKVPTFPIEPTPEAVADAAASDAAPAATSAEG